MWLDDAPLSLHCSSLFELCNNKNITVNEFFEKNGSLCFRRWLPTILNNQWETLKSRVLNLHLIDEPDEISWKWTRTGKITIKSIYDQLTSSEAGDPYNKIWKVKSSLQNSNL